MAWAYLAAARNKVGYGPASDSVTVPARTGDALVVLRPDGNEWVSDVSSPDLAMVSELYPGGAPAAGYWLGNGSDGRVHLMTVDGTKSRTALIKERKLTKEVEAQLTAAIQAFQPLFKAPGTV